MSQELQFTDSNQPKMNIFTQQKELTECNSSKSAIHETRAAQCCSLEGNRRRESENQVTNQDGFV